MSSIVIKGGKKLSGTIEIKGSKNAALPLLAASLLTKQEVTLNDIPEIRDVNNLLRIMEAMKVRVQRRDEKIIIEAKEVDPYGMPGEMVGMLRGSILLIGAMLGRYREIHLPQPGGDVIGARPIDVHLDGLKQLGAEIKTTNNMVHIDGHKMRAGTVTLKEFSVTATENLMMVAATLPGKTTLNVAACEPHVVCLANMLSEMGAKIEGAGTHTIVIRGAQPLSGAEVNNVPDMLEAGLFILMGMGTKSSITVRNVPIGDLSLFFKRVDDIGGNYVIEGNTVKIEPAQLTSFSIQTMPHPGLATDLQAPFSVIATQAEGASMIHDPMYESRFRHCDELVKMGAAITVCDPHRVIIEGPTQLYGGHIASLDIRSGATLIMAGLVAKGETVIDEAEIIERGYADLVERLQGIGADIERVDQWAEESQREPLDNKRAG